MASPVVVYALVTLLAITFVPLFVYQAKLVRWFKLKRYQYEVSFGLYMMTPTEKFIINSLVFLFIALTLIAITLYLPEHLLQTSRRGLYYITGTFSSKHHSPPASAAEVLSAASASASEAVEAATSSISAKIMNTTQAMLEAGQKIMAEGIGGLSRNTEKASVAAAQASIGAAANMAVPAQ